VQRTVRRFIGSRIDRRQAAARAMFYNDPMAK